MKIVDYTTIEVGRRLFGVKWNPEDATLEELQAVIAHLEISDSLGVQP